MQIAATNSYFPEMYLGMCQTCDGTCCENSRHAAQKIKFSIKDFCSKCDQIRRKLRIWSHLRKKSLMENFFFYAVTVNCFSS